MKKVLFMTASWFVLNCAYASETTVAEDNTVTITETYGSTDDFDLLNLDYLPSAGTSYLDLQYEFSQSEQKMTYKFGDSVSDKEMIDGTNAAINMKYGVGLKNNSEFYLNVKQTLTQKLEYEYENGRQSSKAVNGLNDPTFGYVRKFADSGKFPSVFIGAEVTPSVLKAKTSNVYQGGHSAAVIASVSRQYENFSWIVSPSYRYNFERNQDADNNSIKTNPFSEMQLNTKAQWKGSLYAIGANFIALREDQRKLSDEYDENLTIDPINAVNYGVFLDYMLQENIKTGLAYSYTQIQDFESNLEGPDGEQVSKSKANVARNISLSIMAKM